MGLKLNAVFADGMVLQRGKEVTVWGEVSMEDSSDRGNCPDVKVTFGGKSSFAKVKNGKWSVRLSPHEAATGLALTVEWGQEQIKVSDVAVGDVWVAGGQSNMEFYLKYEQHVLAGGYPEFNDNIRFFDLPEIAYLGQEDAFDYSNMSVWRKAASTKDLDYFSAVGFYFAQKLYEAEKVPIGIVGCNWGGTAILAWMDPESVKRVGKPWWEEVQKQLAGVDMEEYFKEQNRNFMNDTGNPMTDPFTEYMLPVVRTDEEAAEFMEKHAPEQGNQNVAAGGLPVDGSFSMIQPKQLPGAMYEHMVKKIMDFAIKGFIFYQGESDDEMPFGPEIYDKMFGTMIDDWRNLWGEEALPFLAVQLAPFRHWMSIECNNYVTIRQKQQQVADTKENVYLASIGDVGMEMDIHPKDKKAVGERLALLALGHVYGKEILCEAPRASKIERKGNRILVEFAHAGDGLYMKEEREIPLKVLDEEENEIPFTYSLSGNVLQVEIKTAETNKVRLAFAWTNWYCINLYNSAKIPAFPFRSDWL